MKLLEERFEAITHKATFMMEEMLGKLLELEMKEMEMMEEFFKYFNKYFLHRKNFQDFIFKIMAVGIQ